MTTLLLILTTNENKRISYQI